MKYIRKEPLTKEDVPVRLLTAAKHKVVPNKISHRFGLKLMRLNGELICVPNTGIKKWRRGESGVSMLHRKWGTKN